MTLPALAPAPLPKAPTPPEVTTPPQVTTPPELIIPDIATVPEVATIRLVAVPPTAPPFDDVLSGDFPYGGSRASDVASGPLTSEQTHRPARAPRADAAWHAPGGHWPSQFAQLLAEALAGSRPASQLAPWTSVRTRRRISQLAVVLATPHRPRIRRVIVTSPASGILEMSVIAIFGTRVRALAVRLERRPPAVGTSAQATDPAPVITPGLAEGWSCTAIEAA